MKNHFIKPATDPDRTAHSCPQPPEIARLQEWCSIAGHFRTSDHSLATRTIHERVLIYCVAGSGWLDLERRHHTITAGDLFFCPSNHPHRYGCCTSAGWEIWWIHFQGTHADALCRAAGLTPREPVLHAGVQPDLAMKFGALLDCLAAPTPDTPWKAAEKLHAILTALVRIAGKNVRTTNLSSLVDSTVSSLDELAARSNYSKYHFCRLFKEETGYSPWQVVLDHKLERARELLLGSQLSIKEIAAELGFPNADYFARRFARHTGANPGSYRGQRSDRNRNS
jgi:AraC-like DNA-binding protein